MKKAIFLLGILFLSLMLSLVSFWVYQKLNETRVLRAVIDRLSAESRVAEVIVTKSILDEATGKIRTTIKFLEYAAAGNALEPRYFTFHGNIIQFQALVIRFEDKLVRAGDALRGKSAYLFLKAFALGDETADIFELTKVGDIPKGYRVSESDSKFEQVLWSEFWSYVLEPETRLRAGIKNAQVEAPGSIFYPGLIYTIRIEHDGGLRVDSTPIPNILKDEFERAS